MPTLRIALLALATLLSSGLVAGTASAMPANGWAATEQQNVGTLQQVRWVCGPYRCWWQPGVYWGRPYWGWHRHYWGAWGWRRHFWGGWR